MGGGSKMLERFAQKISENTSLIIGYDVIITNKDSIIVGASDKYRIGDFHEGSVKVMQTGEPHRLLPDYTVNMVGTKPGFTVPVEFEGKIIGTIGITGARKEVEKIGFLLKTYTQLFLNQEVHLKTLALSEQAVISIIQEIIAFNPDKHSEIDIINHGKRLGYDLTRKRISIVFDFFNFGITDSRRESDISNIEVQTMKLNMKSVIEHHFDTSKDICVYIGNDKFVVEHELFDEQTEENACKKVQEICGKVFDDAKKKGIKISAGIGTLSNSIVGLRKSYEDAWRILNIINKEESPYQTYFVGDYMLEVLLSSTEKDIGDWYIEKSLDRLRTQLDYEDCILTIKTWCESGFKNAEASKRLFIHRNTFNYRLEKIGKILNRNLKIYKNAIEVYVAIKALESTNDD
jgi:carbohydrate diacid regulator